MSKILENLRDPAWWFTALFVAMLASLFAAYARDGINVVLSLVSQAWAARVESRRARLQRRVRTVAQDPTLLTVELNVFLIRLGLFLALLVVFVGLSIPVLANLLSDPVRRTAVATLAIISGLACVYIIFRVKSNSTWLSRAYREYRSSSDDPGPPNEGAAGDGQKRAAPERPSR